MIPESEAARQTETTDSLIKCLTMHENALDCNQSRPAPDKVMRGCPDHHVACDQRRRMASGRPRRRTSIPPWLSEASKAESHSHLAAAK
jgi:hypothetical protein